MLKPSDVYPIAIYSATHAAAALEETLNKLNERQFAFVLILGFVLIVLTGAILEAPLLCLLRLILRLLFSLLIRAPEIIQNWIVTKTVEALVLSGLAILAGVSWRNGVLKYLYQMLQ
jgi:hypothetical protein